MTRESAEDRLGARTRRIAGQVTGIERMLAEDRYCLDILNQIAAVRSALDALGVELLHRHIENCVVGHGEGTEHPQAAPMSRDELLSELRAALTRFLR